MMQNKLTLKVIKLAYYDGHLVYPKEIIENFKGDKVPSWATLANGTENKTTKVNKTLDNVGQNEKQNLKTPENTENIQENVSDTVGQKEEKSEFELQEELNSLLDESVAKGIIIDDFENKTISEQISELKTLLGK